MAGLAGAATGGGEVRRPAGRPKRSFSPSQRGEILGLIRSGLGRVLASEKMGMSPKTFRRIVREDRDFALAVREAERARVEGCEFAIYRLATLGYESPVVLRAALSYLGRRDKIDEARRAGRKMAREAEARDS